MGRQVQAGRVRWGSRPPRGRTTGCRPTSPGHARGPQGRPVERPLSADRFGLQRAAPRDGAWRPGRRGEAAGHRVQGPPRPLGKGPDFSPTSSASPGGILIMTSTHPLHLQSLHNHHDANSGFWGRDRIFQFFFLLVLRPPLGLPGFHLVQPGLEALAHPPQHAGEVRVVEGDHLRAVAPPGGARQILPLCS